MASFAQNCLFFRKVALEDSWSRFHNGNIGFYWKNVLGGLLANGETPSTTMRVQADEE